MFINEINRRRSEKKSEEAAQSKHWRHTLYMVYTNTYHHHMWIVGRAHAESLHSVDRKLLAMHFEHKYKYKYVIADRNRAYICMCDYIHDVGIWCRFSSLFRIHLVYGKCVIMHHTWTKETKTRKAHERVSFINEIPMYICIYWNIFLIFRHTVSCKQLIQFISKNLDLTVKIVSRATYSYLCVIAIHKRYRASEKEQKHAKTV